LAWGRSEKLLKSEFLQIKKVRPVELFRWEVLFIFEIQVHSNVIVFWSTWCNGNYLRSFPRKELCRRDGFHLNFTIWVPNGYVHRCRGWYRFDLYIWVRTLYCQYSLVTIIDFKFEKIINLSKSNVLNIWYQILFWPLRPKALMNFFSFWFFPDSFLFFFFL